MKKIIDWLKFGTGVSICLMIAFFISIFILKARQSSSSWVTVDNSSPASLYVGNNETLTSAKRNRLVQKANREEVPTSDTALFDTNCDRKWQINESTKNFYYATNIRADWSRIYNSAAGNRNYLTNIDKDTNQTWGYTVSHIRKKCP